VSLSPEQIAQVRAFNRDYTRRIGVLQQGLHDSPYSLAQVRVMYEIAHRSGVTAGELADDLGLDRGYLSRILKRFEAKKLIAREPSADDARRHHLRLTPEGRRVFAPLERRSQQQVGAMFARLDETRQQAVLQAMTMIHTAFAAQSQRACADGGRVSAGGVTLRTHRPGDMGWVVQRHGELYHQEYGWTDEFEALVAQITVDFIRKLDPKRERCWIAERDGRRLGCIFLVAQDASTAKLRLLLVDPEARGMGLGRTLVTECVRFAREVGYRKIVLWTQDILHAARHLYAQAGFRKIAQEPHHSFGADLIGETWELEW
jgi:DNA-binding MarR family transcriptional regulator/N-acetylglutamate synthase-like GNAT family acetyltransferase